MVKKEVVVASTTSIATAITIQKAQAGRSMFSVAYAPAQLRMGAAPPRYGDACMQIEQITDPAGLESLLDDARAAGRCALDTEFVWERTYAPVLCLVQIATPDRLAVVDPLRGAPL